jgi:hypothetical protein
MEKATFVIDDPLRQELMIGTNYQDGRRLQLVVADTRTRPSGDLITTPHEMGNFMRMMLDDGSFDGKAVLRPETLRSIYTNCAAVDPIQGGACLGLKREVRKGFTLYLHGGDHVTYRSAWWLVPTRGIGIWAGNNSNIPVYEDFFAAFMQKFAASAAAEIHYPRHAAADMSQFLGTYRRNSSSMSRSGRFFDIFPDDDDVRVKMRKDGALTIGEDRYEPIGARNFQRVPSGSYPSSSVVTFFRSALNENFYMQSGEDSAAKIPWYLHASINHRFAMACLSVVTASIFAGIIGALRRNDRTSRTVWLVTSATGIVFLVGAMLLISSIAAGGRQLLWGFPESFLIGRILLRIGAACALGLLIVLCVRKFDRRLFRFVALASVVTELTLFLWAFYWEFV